MFKSVNISIKGISCFVYTKSEGLTIMFRDLYKDYEKENWVDILDEMTGKDFLDFVLHGSIMDSDGLLSYVIVDGYLSNLGLFSVDMNSNFTQGCFLVDPNTWYDICEEHDVKVYWANK